MICTNALDIPCAITPQNDQVSHQAVRYTLTQNTGARQYTMGLSFKPMIEDLLSRKMV